MSNLQQQIEKAQAESAAALEAQINKLKLNDEVSRLAPVYEAVKRVSYAVHNDVTTINYEVNNADEVIEIINQYREKYGAFKGIGKYANSCTIVSAYPWKEYINIPASEYVDDAVEARNSKGKGFSSVGFEFYPDIEGKRIAVTIDLAFRSYVKGFEGYINANYDRAGDCTSADKRPPSAHQQAEYRVTFGGGSRDSADWRGVFNANKLVALLTEEVTA